MTIFKCNDKCSGWKNMVNFIHDLPFYLLANYCSICKVWYPKHTLVKCACCNKQLRVSRRTPSSKDVDRFRNLTPEYIESVIRAHQAKGWTLINENVMKAAIDFQLEKNKKKLRLSK